MNDQTNDAGRGFNLVVVDNETLQPTKLSHMDTYTFGRHATKDLFLSAKHVSSVMLCQCLSDSQSLELSC